VSSHKVTFHEIAFHVHVHEGGFQLAGELIGKLGVSKAHDVFDVGLAEAGFKLMVNLLE
jgi:hypothetical protein